MTHIDEIERKRSLHFLGTPNKWPRAGVNPSTGNTGNYVHVKRRKDDGGMPETGIIYEDQPTIIRRFNDANPFEFNGTDSVYKSHEEMISDGWVID